MTVAAVRPHRDRLAPGGVIFSRPAADVTRVNPRCADATRMARSTLGRRRIAMSQAHVHLAYAPRGPGLLYAVMWFAVADDILGWFIGARDGEHVASYFVLQDYYSSKETRFFRSLEDDVRGSWAEVRASGAEEPSPSPVPEDASHELNRLQDAFVRHWLFFDDDPEAGAEGEALRQRELPVRHANIRASQLDKLQTGAAVWHHDSPDTDRSVLIHLSRRWPLDFEAEG
jgi:hypothetical protein